MAAPYHKILSKTDRALVAYLIANVAGGACTTANTFPAKRSLDKSLPLVICASLAAHLETENPGVYRTQSQIIVKSSAALESGVDPNQPRLNDEALQGAVFDALKMFITPDNDDSALADAITSAAHAMGAADPNNADLVDFTCLRVFDKGVSLSSDEGGTFWADTLHLELVVCPSNVS